MADQSTTAVLTRLPQPLLDRLDATAERLSAASFGIAVSRTRVVMLALERGLEELDRELKTREK